MVLKCLGQMVIKR